MMLTLVTYDHPSSGQLSVIFKLIDEKTGLKYGNKILNPLKYFEDYLRALYNRWRTRLSKYVVHIRGTDLYITKMDNIGMIEVEYCKHRRELEEYERELKTFLVEGKIEKLYYKRMSRRSIWRSVEDVLKYVNEARRIIEEKEGVTWEEYVSKILSKNITDRFRIFYLPLLPRDIAEKYFTDRNIVQIFERQRNMIIEMIRQMIKEEASRLREEVEKVIRGIEKADPVLVMGKVAREVRKLVTQVEQSGLSEELSDMVEKLRQVLECREINTVASKLEAL